VLNNQLAASIDPHHVLNYQFLCRWSHDSYLGVISLRRPTAATLDRGYLTAIPALNQEEIDMALPVLKSSVVLIVEDEFFIRSNAMALMNDLGHVAFEADGADEAISVLEQHPEIAVIVTDIQMAGSMDGLALARYASGRWPPLRFIIVSGGATPVSGDMPNGAIFLAKPYVDNDLSSVIQDCV
jgi:CheY-like chemotaxis protein